MENVPGMAKGRMKGCFIEIMKTLKVLPYQVKCKQMNAMHYGVPQSRERLIFIGSRNVSPLYPAPQHTRISVKQALNINGHYLYRANYSKGKVDIIKKTFDYPLLTLTKKENWQVYFDSKGQFNKREYSIDNPIQTITKGNAYHLKLGTAETKAQKFTIEQVLKLCSFPVDWKMTGSYSDKWARLGNAVMPKFMQAIAETIKKEILGYI